VSAVPRFVGAAAACAGVGIWLGLREPTTRLTFLSVGQGDCAVLQHDGRTILVDAGPTSGSFDAGARVVLPKLRSMGVERVDLLLLTHPDSDHLGGAGAVLRAFPGARIAIPGTFREHPQLKAYLAQWKLRPESVVWLGARTEGRVGAFTLSVVCPPPGQADNDGSAMVRITAGDAGAVLTGDAPSDVERKAAAEGDWSAQVVNAGHHGSRSSTSAAWLREVRPEWVVVSCGRDNRYGHPSPEVLERVARAGAKLARTDREGDVAFELSGGRWLRVP